MKQKISTLLKYGVLGAFVFASSFGVSRAIALKQNAASNATMDIGTAMRHITFSVTKDAGYNNSIYLVGSFCDWDPADPGAIRLSWSNGNVWSASIDVVSNDTQYECKFVINATENPVKANSTYENGSNRAITFNVSTTYNWNWQYE